MAQQPAAPDHRTAEVSAAVGSISFGLLGLLLTQDPVDLDLARPLALASILFLSAAVWDLGPSVGITSRTPLGELPRLLMNPRAVLMVGLAILLYAGFIMVRGVF